MQKESGKVAASIAKVEKNIAEASGQQRSSPYLLAADSFHFLQLTQRLLDTGAISERIEGSKYHNDLMMAPKGYMEPITWHPHVGAAVYRTLSVFRPGMDLMEAVGYVPLVLTACALAVFLLCCWTIGLPSWSTFIGAVFFVCSPIFIKRSSWGWYDNDPYNIIFPLLALAALFAAFRGPITKRRAGLTAAVISLLMLIYAYFWQGWLLMFGITAGGLGLACAVSWLISRDPQRARWEAGTALIYGLLTIALIAVFFGPKEFFLLCLEGFGALRNFLQPQLSVWPDLYISVGELHQASLFEILIITGGFVFGIGALIGLILSIALPGPAGDVRRKSGLVLGFFLAMSLIITLGAQRFALLCLPPLSLLFTIGIQSLGDLATHLLPRRNKTPPSPGGPWVIRIALMLLIVIPIWTLNRNMPRLLNPIYNDTWHAAMQEIERRTPQNSIINAWWPPGHFIKATGKRRVTFDGATINHPQAYWLTRGLFGAVRTGRPGHLAHAEQQRQ